MPRSPRQASATGYYHVVARGHNRRAIFLDAEDYHRYLDAIARFRQGIPCRCYHFCLMPNHVHLLLRADEVETLTAFMRRLQQAYQFHWRRRYELVGHLWQGRFKSFPIEQESYFLECARYIERNPVRANLCQRPEEYPWSSARAYVRGEWTQWGFLDRDPFYEDLGADDQRRRERYQQHLSQGQPYEQLVDAQMERLVD